MKINVILFYMFLADISAINIYKLHAINDPLWYFNVILFAVFFVMMIEAVINWSKS